MKAEELAVAFLKRWQKLYTEAKASGAGGRVFYTKEQVTLLELASLGISLLDFRVALQEIGMDLVTRPGGVVVDIRDGAVTVEKRIFFTV